MAQVLDEVADINDYNNNENDISITKHGIRTVTDINNTFTEPPLYLFSGYTKHACANETLMLSCTVKQFSLVWLIYIFYNVNCNNFLLSDNKLITVLTNERLS